MADREKIKAALVATPDCLSLGQLEALASAQDPTDPHLVGCPRCQAELSLLRQFEANEPLPDEGAAVAWIGARLEQRLEQIKHPKRGARASGQTAGSGLASLWHRLLDPGRHGLLVPAAAVLTVAVMGIVLLRPSREPELRAGLNTGTQVFRSSEVEVIAPAGDLEQAPIQLQWKAFEGASRYKVSLMEVDHSVLWAGETAENTVEVPAFIRAKMLPSKPLLWQVVAVDPQGKVLASSQAQRFRVISRQSGVHN